MKKIQQKYNKELFFTFILVMVLFVTVSAVTQPQRFIQFASESFSAPPLFGCLQVGPGDRTNCASRLGVTLSATPIMLHGRPLDKQTVYYGDRLTGSATFTNVGDLPIEVESFSMVALSKQKKYFVVFPPTTTNKTIQPHESVSVSDASYKFQARDPIGEWIATYIAVDKNQQAIPTDTQTKLFIVNSTCTALRIKELTEKDKTNIASLCNKNPNSKLCNSRQYCEIFNGRGQNCTKPNVSQEKPLQQCDEWIVPSKAEQDLLEELCKAHPDTDACINFCKRSLQSPICPKLRVWVDKKTGKEVVPPPKIIKEPQNLATKANANQNVAGIQTQDNAPGACVNGGAGFASCGTGTSAQRSTTGSTAPGARTPPAPRPAPASPRPASNPTASIPSNPCGARPAPCGNPAPQPVAVPPPPACEPYLPVGCCHATECQLALEERTFGNAGPSVPDGTICAVGAQVINGMCQPGPGVCGSRYTGLQYCTSPQDIVSPDPGGGLSEINSHIPQPVRVLIGTDPECNDSFNCTLLTSIGESAATYATTGAIAGCAVTVEVGCAPGAIGGAGIGLVSGTIVGIAKGVGKYYLHEAF